jgi:hypothetical protein
MRIILFLFIFAVYSAYGQDDLTYRRMKDLAYGYFIHGQYIQSAETYEKAISIKANKSGYSELYNAACAWSLAGNSDKAFKHLDYLSSAVMTDPMNILGKENQDPILYLFEPDLFFLHSDKRWDLFIQKLQMRQKPIIRTLDSIYFDDQYYRGHIDSCEKKYGLQSAQMKALWQIISTKDSLNVIKVKDIINKYGWLGIDSVGKRGNNTQFLVIQHADLNTQIVYLPIMREAVKKKKALGSQLALLEDRVALSTGKKQIYGTQIGRFDDGKFFVLPLEEPDSVDIRRKRVFLGGMYYYVKHWSIIWNAEAYKKQLPYIEKYIQTHK